MESSSSSSYDFRMENAIDYIKERYKYVNKSDEFEYFELKSFKHLNKFNEDIYTFLNIDKKKMVVLPNNHIYIDDYCKDIYCKYLLQFEALLEKQILAKINIILPELEIQLHKIGYIHIDKFRLKYAFLLWTNSILREMFIWCPEIIDILLDKPIKKWCLFDSLHIFYTRYYKRYLK